MSSLFGGCEFFGNVLGLLNRLDLSASGIGDIGVLEITYSENLINLDYFSFVWASYDTLSEDVKEIAKKRFLSIGY
jgi:hypothetical protein